MRAVVLACALTACSTSAGGPDYAELELSATEAQGAETDRFCLMLPVLPGAKTEHTFDFTGGFSAHARADRDQVEVEFRGLLAAPVTSLTAERLEREYESSFPVQTSGASSFVLTLRSPCRQEAPPADTQ